MNIVQGSPGTVEDVRKLKQMFSRRFRKWILRSKDYNQDQEDLDQGMVESLEDYYTGAQQIITQVCESSLIKCDSK